MPSKLLKAIASNKVGEAGASLQANRQMQLNLAQLDQFATAVETQFPLVRLHEAAMGKKDESGNLVMSANADKTLSVPYAVIQGGKGFKSQPSGAAVVYSSGSVNLTGELTKLVWPPVKAK